MATATQERQGDIKQAEIVNLARTGLSNVAIGERLGCSESLVRYHVKAWVASKEPPAERANELRETWYDRLEFAHERNWPGVEQGDPKAIEVMLKIKSEAAKLFALDLQRDITVNVLTRESLAELVWADDVVEGVAVEIEANTDA